MSWLSEQFELSRGTRGHNVRPMEGLRGFAVFLVFLVHYVTLINPWVDGASSLSTFARGLHTIGNTGVDLFFVLSGYLIYGSLISRDTAFLPFIGRRVERIYPAFSIVFAIYVVLSFLVPSESKLPTSSFAAAIYLVENFLLLPGLFPIEPLITVAWSLSYEMFFYLIIPLIIICLDLRRRGIVWRISLFGVTATLVVVCCAAYGGPIRMVMFLSGILLYEMMSRRVRAPASAIALCALLIGLSITLLPFGGSIALALKVSAVSASFFILCFSCFSYPTAWLGKMFSWTPLRWLGNMSYSYYLLHGLSLKVSFVLLGMFLATGDRGQALFWSLLLPMFVLTLIPSGALFIWIERPLSLTPKKVGPRANIIGLGKELGCATPREVSIAPSMNSAQGSAIQEAGEKT